MTPAIPLPDDARERLELALRQAGIAPDQVKALAAHGCAIIPLAHDRSRRESVDLKVYSHALIAVQFSIGDIQRLREDNAALRARLYQQEEGR